MWSAADRLTDSQNSDRHELSHQLTFRDKVVKTRGSVSAAAECPKVNQFVQYSKEALSQAKVAAIVAGKTAKLPSLTGSMHSLAIITQREHVNALCGIACQALVFKSDFDNTFVPRADPTVFLSFPEGSADKAAAHWCLEEFGEGSRWYRNLLSNPGNGTPWRSTLFRTGIAHVGGERYTVFTAYFDGTGSLPGGQILDDCHAVITLLSTIKYFFGAKNVTVRLAFVDRVAQRDAVHQLLSNYMEERVLVHSVEITPDGGGIVCILKDRPAGQFL